MRRPTTWKICLVLLLALLSGCERAFSYGERTREYRQRFAAVGSSGYRLPMNPNARLGAQGWPPGKGAFTLAAKRSPLGPNFALNYGLKHTPAAKLQLPNYRVNTPFMGVGIKSSGAYKQHK